MKEIKDVVRAAVAVAKTRADARRATDPTRRRRSPPWRVKHGGRFTPAVHTGPP